MVLFPLALLWVAAVLFFVIRRSTNAGPDDPGRDPVRFRPRRPRGPGRTGRGAGRTHSPDAARARRSA